jgi:hypothetical protein
MTRQNKWISNALLISGVLLLVLFGVAEMQGLATDPLMPALSALLIGSTAVLDRLGSREFE